MERELKLHRQRVPNDGSCLFYAIKILTFDPRNEPNDYNYNPDEARRYCSEIIKSMSEDNKSFDQEIPLDVFLGKSVDDYTDWILSPFTYGGQIEVTILQL
jgi:hypothetical protein